MFFVQHASIEIKTLSAQGLKRGETPTLACGRTHECRHHIVLLRVEWQFQNAATPATRRAFIVSMLVRLPC